MKGKFTMVEKAFGLIHATLVAEWKELVWLEDYEIANEPEEAVKLFGVLQDMADSITQALAKLKEVHGTISWLATEIAERRDGTPPGGE